MAASASIDLAGSSSSNGALNPAPEMPAPLKPLEELTESDIRQLTREDCRRYLKERGMRRPSWNKAQAIQQVLSLRSLMCSSSPVVCSSKNPAANAANVSQADAAANAHTKQYLEKVSQQSMPHSSPSNNASDPRPVAGCFGSFLSTFQQPVCNPSSQDAKLNSQSSKTAAVAKPHRAQLTIFYSGVVNVYDDVPIEKAQAIMLLASSKTFHLPANPMPIYPPSAPRQQESHEPQDEAAQQRQKHKKQQQQNLQVPPLSNQVYSPQLEESCTDPGLPQVRSASLQRFLAKRRDRLSGTPSSHRRSEKPKKRRVSPPLPLLPSIPNPSQFVPSIPGTTPSCSTTSSTATTNTTATTTTSATTTARDSSSMHVSDKVNGDLSSDTIGSGGGTSGTCGIREDENENYVSSSRLA